MSASDYNPIGQKPWSDAEHRRRHEQHKKTLTADHEHEPDGKGFGLCGRCGGDHKENAMTKKKAAPTKAVAPYYVNPHTKEPVDYPNIIAYCRHGRSKPYWVRSQIEQAKAINAPQTTVSVRDGKATDFYEIKNPDLLEFIVATLERGVCAPPPETPCKHCQEDTSDGFHSCEGTEADAETRAI
ncbi:MAG: hypothetical protein V4510_09935 [bacterium]